MKKNIFTIIFLLLLGSPIFAQVIDREWHWKTNNPIYLDFDHYGGFTFEFNQKPGNSGGSPVWAVKKGTDYALGIRMMNNKLCVGIGTTQPKGEMEIRKNVLFSRGMRWDNGVVMTLENPASSNTYINSFQNNNGNDLYTFNSPDHEGILAIRSNGKVGIGTNNPQAALDVNGTIVATRVSLNIGSFPDYVFAKDYKLMNLYDLEQFVNTNKHLPGVPSESEMVENGMDLTKMNTMLMEKVEELTLHTINQQKIIDQQKEVLDKVLDRLNELEQQVSEK